MTWFNANFPTNYFGTHDTVMGTSNVNVQNDPNNAQMRDITVTANTQVDTFFMKWLGFNATTVSATGTASRRDVVIEMIIDRSASMNSNNGCTNMRAAAKLFTGQFAAGRDRIGMVEFGDTSWVDSAPSTSFQTTLGYTAAGGASGSGLIDSISCGDNTGTAQAISLAYNELYKQDLPGALNVLMFFTDGIPNSVSLNFQNVMLSTSNCKDSTGKALSSGGSFVSNPPAWTSGWTQASGSIIPSPPSGPLGVIASDDPSIGGSYGVRHYHGYSQSSTNHGTLNSTSAPGCAFTSNETNFYKDFQLLPPTDIWGNATVNDSYNPMTLGEDSNGNIKLYNEQETSSHTQLTGNNLIFHYAARNAADSAAAKARSNATIPATIFGVGLGGTSQAPPGFDFMQRICNDPNADQYNSPALYPACSLEPSGVCVTESNQPQGTFIYSSDPTKLQGVFLKLASQILRLAK